MSIVIESQSRQCANSSALRTQASQLYANRDWDKMCKLRYSLNGHRQHVTIVNGTQLGNKVHCRWTQTACDNHKTVELCEIRWFLDGYSLSVTIVNRTELCKIRCFSDGQIALVTIIKESRTTGMWFSTIPRRTEVDYGNRETSEIAKPLFRRIRIV